MHIDQIELSLLQDDIDVLSHLLNDDMMHCRRAILYYLASPCLLTTAD